MVNMNSKFHKKYEIGNLTVEGYVDLGSMVTFVQENIYKQIGEPKLRSTEISLIGMSYNQVKPLGYFQEAVKLDGEENPLTIYVIPDGSAPLNAAIGNDITAQARVSIEPDRVVISKLNPTVFLACIDVVPEKVVDVSHIKDTKIQSEIESLVENYEPQKGKSTDVELKIILKDNEPVFDRSARLAPLENEIVESQKRRG